MYKNLNSNSMLSCLPTPWWVAVPSLSPWFHEIFDSSRFTLAPSGAVSLFPPHPFILPSWILSLVFTKKDSLLQSIYGSGSFPREFKGKREGGHGTLHDFGHFTSFIPPLFPSCTLKAILQLYCGHNKARFSLKAWPMSTSTFIACNKFTLYILWVTVNCPIPTAHQDFMPIGITIITCK